MFVLEFYVGKYFEIYVSLSQKMKSYELLA